MRVKGTFSLVLAMILSSAARAGEVHLGRLSVTVGGGAEGAVLAGVSLDVIERFCGDAEGCQVVLHVQAPAAPTTWTLRLFLDGAAGTWNTTDALAYYTDGDGTADWVSRLADVSSDNHCTLSDGDAEDAGADQGPGFQLALDGPDVPGDVTCTITVMD